MLTDTQTYQLKDLFVRCASMKASSLTALLAAEYPDLTVEELANIFRLYKLWTSPEEEYLVNLYNVIDSFDEVVQVFNQKYSRTAGALSSRIRKLVDEGTIKPIHKKHSFKTSKEDTKPNWGNR